MPRIQDDLARRRFDGIRALRNANQLLIPNSLHSLRLRAYPAFQQPTHLIYKP